MSATAEQPASRASAGPQLPEAIRALERWGAERDWRGTDPYDGLNATRLAGPLERSELGKRLLTQAVKRSPLDLRPLFGIEPAHSAVTFAHLTSAYARSGFLEAGERDAKLEAAARRLAELRSSGYEEPCWGYHFPVQTRVFFYAAGAPNTIATSFAGMALVDAYERLGRAEHLELAEGAADFFMRHVPRTPGRGGAFFGYLAGDRTPIHNANLLACALLARVAAHVHRPDLREAAREGLAYTLAHQRSDGSWPYGEEPHLDWVDGFHTGYVLECIGHCAAAGVDEGTAAALDRGLRQYRGELFLADGTPRYTPDSTYPIDAQCAAQGIQTLALAGELEAAERVLRFTLERMRRTDGAFVFQKRRRWTNPAPHMRWVVGPMLLAFSNLLRAREAR
jgi:hypothetical protein